MNTTTSSQRKKLSAEETVLKLVNNDLLCSCCLRKQSEAPVEEVLRKTSEAILKRRVDETKEEIGKILKRVNNIYGAYLQNEKDTQYLEDVVDVPSFKCITDIKQLEQVLKDQVKKQQYQKQVTVFLIGYSELCNQKYQLLTELHEFFTNQNQEIWPTLLAEEEEEEEEGEGEGEAEAESEVEAEEVEGRETASVSCDPINDVITTLDHHTSLSWRLADIKQEMVKHLMKHGGVLNKAAAIGGGGGRTRNRKKPGKSSQQTKDISSLRHKIKQLTSDQEMKQRSLDELMIQLENKDEEHQRIQLESEEAVKELQEEILQKDRLMTDLKQTVSHLCSKLTDKCFNNDNNSSNSNNSMTPSSCSVQSLLQENKESMLDLSEKIQMKELSHEDALKVACTVHQGQLQKLQSVHQQEVEYLQQEQNNSIEVIKESKTGHKDGSQKGTTTKKTKLTTTKQKSKGELKSSGKTSKTKDKDHINTPSAQQTGRGGGAGKDKSDGSGKGSKSQSKQSKVVKATAASTAAASASAAAVSSITETVFDQSVLESLDTFDLSDNEAWGRLPVDQMPQRFSQYRWLTMKKLKELDEQLKLTTLRTQRKVESLKSQFQEHRFKWDEERELLHEQVKQLRTLQVTAEKEADNVMSQLEDFISEQEKMDLTNDENNILQESKNSMKDLQRNYMYGKEPEVRGDAVVGMPHIEEELYADEDNNNNISNNMDQSLTISQLMPCNQADPMEDVVTIATEEIPLSSPLPPPSSSSWDVAGSADQRKQGLTDGQCPVGEMKGVVDQGVSCDLGGKVTEFNSMQEFRNTSSLPDVPDAADVPDEADAREAEVPRWLTAMVETLTNYRRKMETFLKLQDIDSANDLLSDIDPAKAVTQKMAEDMALTVEKFLSALKTATQSLCDTILTKETVVSPHGADCTTTGPSSNISVKTLMELYNTLQCQLIEESRKHEEKERHNHSIIEDLQQTINLLQQHISAPTNSSVLLEQSTLSTPLVMFTRFDLERNQKAMRKGLATHTVDLQKYQNIVKQMTEYVSLPERYFRRIVYSYLCHCNLKTVYDYLLHKTKNPTDQPQQRTEAMNESLHAASLAKLATLHSNKFTHWSTSQASLSKYRQNIAMTLTSNLESLETDTGLLLIKPVYWHTNNKTNPKYKETLQTRAAEMKRQRLLMNYISDESEINEDSVQKLTRNSSLTNPDLPRTEDMPTLNPHFNKMASPERQLMATTSDMGINNNSVAMWTMPSFQPSDPEKWSPSLHITNSSTTVNDNNNTTNNSKVQQPVSLSYNGPLISKIQELDINTMMIYRNNVFTDRPSNDDQQVSKLRSYFTVYRPTLPLPNDLTQETSSTQPHGLCGEALPSSLSRQHSLSMSSDQNLANTDYLVPKPALSKSFLPPISSWTGQ